MRKEALEILNKFDATLEDLISDVLFGNVTPEEVNEYYGWGSDCQIAQMLREAQRRAERLDKWLREKGLKGGEDANNYRADV